MRVAFIHSGYSRHLVTGIIRVETELVAALRARGHVAEIMPWETDDGDAPVQQQYFRIVRPAAFVYRKVRDFINAGKYDVVVFQGVGYPETRALPWLKRETQARFVVMQHGWPLYSPATRLLVSSYMQAIGHVLLAEADAIVAVSNYVKSHLSSYVDPDRVEVIYPGVDTVRFSPQKRVSKVRAQILQGEKYLLMTNGKLAAHKNVSTLLRALPYLPNVAAMLVGSGSHAKERSYRELAVELGVSKRVHFLGTVPNEQLPEYYAAADLLVHPSRSEALGIVLLEALACGVPVVAANVGGIPEAVVPGFNGALYDDARDHKKLAQTISALLQNDDLKRQLGANGRQFVRARFDWRTILPQHIHLLQRVAASDRSLDVDEDGLFGAFA